MADLRKYIQSQEHLLQSSISATATSLTLQSFKTSDLTNITTTDIGNLGHATLDPNTSSEESISFTTITQNGDGTATISGITRGLKFVDPYTETTSLKLAHGAASVFIMTNTSAYYAGFLNKNNDETIAGTYTYTSTAIPIYNSNPTFTDDKHIISKKYADDLAIAGAPDGSTTVKGIFEEATQAEIDAGTATGGTSARLAINPSTLATSIYNTQLPTSDEKDALAGTGTPNSSNKYVTDDDTATAATANKVARRLAGGNVTVITESQSNNTTNAASTAYVDTAVAAVAATYANGDETKNAADASTTQNIAHGLGAAPSNVEIIAMLKGPTASAVDEGLSISHVFYNGTTQSSMSNYVSGAIVYTTDNSFTLNTSQTTGTQVGVVTVDATNIIITWTKTGSPTGTYILLWRANLN